MNGIVILGCGASFRSRSPHFFFFFLPGDSPSFAFDNVAHMWLMPINITARGQTPGDRGGGGGSDHHQPDACTGKKKKKKMQVSLPLTLIFPIRPVKHAQPKTNTTSISGLPVGSAESATCFNIT